ncbi:MAG: GMC family oxidoreductase [Saprospiraceae bacterium]
MNNLAYDVVIIGSGITGALIAWSLGQKGKKVLILEAGSEDGLLQNNIDRYYAAQIKIPGSPFLNEHYAPRQNTPGIGIDGNTPVNWKDKDENYWEQTGDSAFDSTYERTMGGTTRHWLGTCLRFLPNDFNLAKKYNVNGALDWPLQYKDLEPYYTNVEKYIGVAGDVTWDNSHGAKHSELSYPMVPVPLSYSDLQVQNSLQVNNVQSQLNTKVQSLLNGKTLAPVELEVVSTPQARVTNTPDDPTGKLGYDKRPPCMGNSSCVPICPIKAKYDATVHINKAIAPLLDKETIKGRVPAVLQTRSVAYQVVVDPKSDLVTGIKYRRWEEGKDGYTEGVATAAIYVIAANAIENAKILLNSPWKKNITVANQSDQVGRNLMDHICLIRWGLMPDPVYGYRGPLSTAGIPAFRDNSSLRPDYAAFRIEIGNDGWLWPASAPFSTVNDLVNGVKDNTTGKWTQEPLFGMALKQKLHDLGTRQIRFAFELESIGVPDSRVTLSDQKDPLGIPRPKVNYVISDYTKEGFALADKIGKEMMDAMKIEDFTSVDETAPGFFKYKPKGETEEKKFQYQGAGHVIGTHRMGTDPGSSVVDPNQRSHDHSNLYIVGCGSFPTAGTANPTLTAAALSLKTVDAILAQLSGTGVVSAKPKLKINKPKKKAP